MGNRSVLGMTAIAVALLIGMGAWVPRSASAFSGAASLEAPRVNPR